MNNKVTTHALHMQQSTSNLIKQYLSQGSPRQALLVYTQARRQGIYHHHIISVLLKACASLSFLNHGKSLHAESIKNGVVLNVILGTSLVSFYSKCCCLVDSRKVFDEMPERNVVTWNAMIGGYSKNGDMGNACVLFEVMPLRSSFTWNEMIDGFARSGDLVAARQLFDQVPSAVKSVVTWTVLVDGYVRNGLMKEARELFEAMPERNFFVWSSMIAGYCKKHDMKEARSIFDRIKVRNSVNWNALIAGYAQNGFCKEAFEAFDRMQVEGFEPDEVTVASLLSASAQLGSLDSGKKIHELIGRKAIKLNQFVLNGLVDMYAKCGDISNARRIFEGIPRRNHVCWNSMISGLAVHGRWDEALEIFRQMKASEQKPNEVTFISVLSACARGGFVTEGLEIFSMMKEKYGLTVGIEHYGCLVDLLGRAGRLVEAYDLIKTMPMKPNDVVWGAFLGACRIHSETELVEQVKEEIGMLDTHRGPGDSAPYVLLSNIYAASDRWERAEKMRMMMVGNGIKKEPGCSSITWQ
ncbi:Pentatricopeptide repeat-containing protein [Thalictrum thalictroides]|uniref:Pentatricopeptide repeat-containing protein n=1 Tax=Thalictrum thalictroides TaxID=46969 RepID=A0A7J6V802_THATH|nr:Pentatricopeptide repeat-containing protein [Thalictrum thalictroides]